MAYLLQIKIGNVRLHCFDARIIEELLSRNLKARKREEIIPQTVIRKVKKRRKDITDKV